MDTATDVAVIFGFDSAEIVRSPILLVSVPTSTLSKIASVLEVILFSANDTPILNVPDLAEGEYAPATETPTILVIIVD